MKRQTGFTLIELMIVIAVIGILVTFGVPMYQDYTIRTQVTEGLSLAAEVKATVGAFNAARGRLPDSNEAASVAKADSITGNYVTSVAIGDNGTITITYGNRANEKIKDRTLGLNPVRNEVGELIWVCGTAAPPPAADEVDAEASTNLDAAYFPADCRQ